jgi:putative permease
LLLAGVLLLLPHAAFVVVHLTAVAACAAVLEPFVSFCTRRRMPRLFACLLALALLAAFVAGFIFWLAPILLKEIAKLTALLNASAPEKVASKLSILILRALPWLRTKSVLQQLQTELKPGIEAFLQTALSFEVAALSNLASYILIAFGIFYVLHRGEHTRRKITGALPNRSLEMGALFWEKTAPRLARFLRVHAFLFLGVSAVLAAAVALMGLPGVFIMSVFGGLALLTPYWGALMAAIPLAIAGANATNSLNVIFGVVLALALLQLLLNTMLSSARFKLTARLQAWEALLALLLGASLAGVWGMLLAGPLAGCAKIILKEVVEVRKSFRG